MKPYVMSDFNGKNAWLVLRVDAQIKDQPIDIYMLMDLPSNKIIAHEIVEYDLIQANVDNLLNVAKKEFGTIPPRILITKGDPAEEFLRKSCKKPNVNVESVPAPYLENLIAPVKESFGQHTYSPCSIGYTQQENEINDFDEDEEVRLMIPDSYEPCSCASGKKYKFCCKKILTEIVHAMCAAEEGNLSEALEWIKKAKAIVGETAEIICREAIVLSYFEPEESEQLLSKCLAIDPNHPRAHYIRGINLVEKGDFHAGIAEYELAIANYPPTDHYHLNECYNNLGVAFHAASEIAKAKSAWEQALLYIPSDKMAKRNLIEFIYNHSDASLVNGKPIDC